MPAVRRRRFMSAVRCFVRTEKHSLNRDLARRSSKPSTKVLFSILLCTQSPNRNISLSIHDPLLPDVLFLPRLLVLSCKRQACKYTVNGYNYNNIRAFTAIE